MVPLSYQVTYRKGTDEYQEHATRKSHGRDERGRGLQAAEHVLQTVG